VPAISYAPPPPEAPVADVPALTYPTTPTPRAGNSVVIETLNVAEAEQQLILRALQVTGGNRTKAAELLGISVRTLRNKLNHPGKDDDEDSSST
jgi:DNA-binding NtrC family response regulator